MLLSNSNRLRSFFCVSLVTLRLICVATQEECGPPKCCVDSECCGEGTYWIDSGKCHTRGQMGELIVYPSAPVCIEPLCAEEDCCEESAVFDESDCTCVQDERCCQGTDEPLTVEATVPEYYTVEAFCAANPSDTNFCDVSTEDMNRQLFAREKREDDEAGEEETQRGDVEKEQDEELKLSKRDKFMRILQATNCDKCRNWYNANRNRKWIAALPACPCTVTYVTALPCTCRPSGSTFLTGSRNGKCHTATGKTRVPAILLVSQRILSLASGNDWDTDLACNPCPAARIGCRIFHPGAFCCIRQDVPGAQPNQQCCYDLLGNLLPHGTRGAGETIDIMLCHRLLLSWGMFCSCIAHLTSLFFNYGTKAHPTEMDQEGTGRPMLTHTIGAARTVRSFVTYILVVRSCLRQTLA